MERTSFSAKFFLFEGSTIIEAQRLSKDVPRLDRETRFGKRLNLIFLKKSAAKTADHVLLIYDGDIGDNRTGKSIINKV